MGTMSDSFRRAGLADHNVVAASGPGTVPLATAAISSNNRIHLIGEARRVRCEKSGVILGRPCL